MECCTGCPGGAPGARGVRGLLSASATYVRRVGVSRRDSSDITGIVAVVSSRNAPPISVWDPTGKIPESRMHIVPVTN